MLMFFLDGQVEINPFCVNTIDAWKIMGYFYYLLRILVPVALLIWAVVPIFKLIMKGTAAEASLSFKSIATKLFIAILFFWSPGVINTLVHLFAGDSYQTAPYAACSLCFLYPASSECQIIVDAYHDQVEAEAEHFSSSETVSGRTPSRTSSGGGQPEATTSPSGGDTPSQGDDIINGDLEVHFINPNSRVDAIYVKVGDKSMFFDGGFKRDGQRESEYLDKIGVTHIDYYVGTHSHKNHVEAAPLIISKYGIKEVYTGYNTCDNSGSLPCTWYTIKLFANEQNKSLSGVNYKELRPGDTFELNGLKVLCVGPMKVINNIARGVTKQNYNSVILRLEYGSVSFLLTGDNSSSSNIKASNNAYPDKLKVNVLKNAHHNGNNSSASYNIFQAEYVVFLTNNDNLPNSSTINAIQNAGAKEYYVVTGNRNGNVVFSSDGTTINVKSNYEP